jgi:hypothetical protein
VRPSQDACSSFQSHTTPQDWGQSMPSIGSIHLQLPAPCTNHEPTAVRTFPTTGSLKKWHCRLSASSIHVCRAPVTPDRCTSSATELFYTLYADQQTRQALVGSFHRLVSKPYRCVDGLEGHQTAPENDKSPLLQELQTMTPGNNNRSHPCQRGAHTHAKLTGPPPG